jgi:glycosyltransferase involved in cell wall biosynthesis
MITGVIIAKNEENNLRECISSLSFCSKLLVIDNNSTDKTSKIAKSCNADVVRCSKQDDFSYLRNFALSRIHTPWTLFVDADEKVTPELGQEIVSVATSTDKKGFYIKRDDYMWGQKLHYGDVRSVKLLRFGRTKSGVWTGKVHETWSIKGDVGQLRNSLKHYPHPTLVSFLQSLNHYSTIRAEELQSQGIKSGIASIIGYPILKFIHLWILKLGFIDGVPGLVHSMSMSFYSFMVRSKLYLLSKGITDTHLR